MTVDLRTRYLGLELRSPIVASAAPHNARPGHGRGASSAPGVGAIVLPSLFEEEILAEEIELDPLARAGHRASSPRRSTTSRPSSRSPAPPTATWPPSSGSRPPSRVPVIASLNASTRRRLGAATRGASRTPGADALELNLYHVAADPRRSAADMEARDLDLIAAVRAAITIPLAVKLSPFYSAFANFAAAAVGAGADGLVLFNRFYQPDLDLETLEVVPRLELSQPWEMRLPVRWIAILRPQLGPDVSLAATSGAHSGADVVKGLLVGADVVMMTSALLRHGPEHVAVGRGRAPGVDDRARVRRRSSELRGSASAGDRRATRRRSSAPTTWRRSVRGPRPRSQVRVPPPGSHPASPVRCVSGLRIHCADGQPRAPVVRRSMAAPTKS